jgi:hypothetical protein
MKHIGFVFLALLVFCPSAHALVYRYEVAGLITFSDHNQQLGYDPFVDIGQTTFKLHGMWGDLGSEAYCTIDGQTYGETSVPYNGPAFSGFDSKNFEGLYLHQTFSHPLGIWHIAGHDYSKELIDDSNVINWDMFGGLNWDIYWISVVHDDPNLPDYWEYDGTITSAKLTASPVPEPSSIFLFGTSLVGLWATKMRKKRNRFK